MEEKVKKQPIFAILLVALGAVVVFFVPTRSRACCLEGASITGYAFLDQNKNGVHDVAESGVSGIGISVYFDDGDNTFNATRDTRIGTNPSVESAINGSYEVDQLASGNYFVQIDPATLPKGYGVGGVQVVGPVKLKSGQAHIDFAILGAQGAAERATISGTVIRDANNNQRHDGDEGGVSAIVVQLYRDSGDQNFDPAIDQKIEEKQTHSDGAFAFEGITKGNYWLTIKAQSIPTELSRPIGHAETMVTVLDTGILQQDLYLAPKAAEVVRKEKSDLKIGVGGISFVVDAGSPTAPLVRNLRMIAVKYVAPLAALLALVGFLWFGRPRSWRAVWLRAGAVARAWWLVLTRRKPTLIGTTYNVLTGEPVAFAIVTLRDAATGGVLRRTASGRFGDFIFSGVERSGRYTIRVTAPDFVFPSTITTLLEGTRARTFAHTFIPSTEDATNFTIPLDPAIDEAPYEILRRHFHHRHFRAILGFVFPVSFIAMIVNFTPLTYLLFIVTMIVFVLWLLTHEHHMRTDWGQVVDVKGRPKKNMVVKLYDQVFGRVASIAVTDHKGHFDFTAAPGFYYLGVFAREKFIEAENLLLAKKRSPLSNYHGESIVVRNHTPHIKIVI